MKNIIKWGILVTMLCVAGWLANTSFKKIQVAKSAKAKINALPTLPLITLDSLTNEISTLARGSLVLIYFNSECDHCQYEAKDIMGNIRAFSQTKLVFMSSEPLVKIRNFARASGLDNYSNVSFTKVDANDAFTSFGALAVPHVFIYGSNKKLIKEFKGETKAEAILKYLN